MHVYCMYNTYMLIILWTNLPAGCRPGPLSPDRRRTCNPGSEVLSWDKNTKQERKYSKQRQPFWGRAPSSEARTCRQGKEEPASGSSQMGHCPGSQRGIPRLKSHMNYNLIWLFWAGVTNSADDSWSLGSVDALALDVEEEALVALEVGARAPLLAVLPRVPHHLAGFVDLGNVVVRGCRGCQGAWGLHHGQLRRKVVDRTSVAHQAAPFSDPALVHLL